MVATQRLTCFCEAAVSRQVAGCVFFTATTACRKMTNGVNGTADVALTICALLTSIRSIQLTDKKQFYIFHYSLYCNYKQWIYIQLLCVRGSDRRENAGLSFGVVEAPAH